jgi:hypothetical protein
MIMYNHTYSLPQAINTLILFSLLVSTGALAQGNAFAGELLTPAVTALQATSNNDCYKGNRNARLILRIKDLSSLWHYATRILMPTAGASAAPHNDADTRKTEKGVVWHVGAGNGGMVVSANLAW